MAGIGDGHNGGGPIWAIFDADAVARENWDPTPPNVDIDAGFFFSADTLAELAGKIVMKYQRVPMPPANLEATVARYNSFVDSGVDEDFGKPSRSTRSPSRRSMPLGRRRSFTTPAPACASTPHCQVVDMHGKVIPGLYCGGESAGGFSQHGLARAACQGYIAGGNAAAEPAKG